MQAIVERLTTVIFGRTVWQENMDSGTVWYSTWQHPPTTRPTPFHVLKTRSCQCSFRLLMMGGVWPKTCWASYKYGIIKFWYIVASCSIFLYELSIMCSFYELRAKKWISWPRWIRLHEYQISCSLQARNLDCNLVLETTERGSREATA
jgi:hypothetical protein